MFIINMLKGYSMSFSEYDVDRRTSKDNFLKQMGVLIDWNVIALEINRHYHPKSDVVGRPAYPGILLFKMLMIGIWNGGLSDEKVEYMANSDLYAIRFLNIKLEDDVPDHSVLSRFRTALTKARAWDHLLEAVNQQLVSLDAMVSDGYHVDASVTTSARKPKRKPSYEVSQDRAERDDEPDAKQAMTVLTVAESGVDTQACWTKKGGQYLFGYKQHTVVNNDGLVKGVVTTAANTHDSQPLIELIDQCDLPEGTRLCADKGYTSAKHSAYLKAKKLKNGIQDKAVRGKPLSARQKKRNKLITQIRFVVERTFGGQALWLVGKNLRYVGLDKAHAWHILQAMAYNLKRLPVLWVKRNFVLKPLQYA